MAPTNDFRASPGGGADCLAATEYGCTVRNPQAMRRNPHVTTAALAAELGMTSTSGIEKHLKAIREAGCMRRTGPAKGGHWEVMQ